MGLYFIHFHLNVRFLFSLQHLWTANSMFFLPDFDPDSDSHVTLSTVLYNLGLSCPLLPVQSRSPGCPVLKLIFIVRFTEDLRYLPAQRDHDCFWQHVHIVTVQKSLLFLQLFPISCRTGWISHKWSSSTAQQSHPSRSLQNASPSKAKKKKKVTALTSEMENRLNKN